MNVEFQSGERLFEWDSDKAKRNKIKHGIGFKLASRVFEDEERRKFFGKVDYGLLVIYIERQYKMRPMNSVIGGEIDFSHWLDLHGNFKLDWV